MMNVFVLILSFLLLFSCGIDQATKPPAGGTTPCKVLHVADGDTFSCVLESGEEVRVRLIGVDTPESSDNPKARRDAEKSGRSVEEIIRMGKLSAEYTKKLLPKGTVVYLEFDVQKTDRYGRYLAYVWLPDGRMLNEVLVREGYATVYTIPPNVKYQDKLLQAERYARENKKGLWSM